MKSVLRLMGAMVLSVAASAPVHAQSNAPLVDPTDLFAQPAAPAFGSVSSMLGTQPPPNEITSDWEFRQAVDAAPPRIVTLTSGRPFKITADTWGSTLLDAGMSCQIVMRASFLSRGDAVKGGPAEVLALKSFDNRRKVIEALVLDVAARHGLNAAQINTLEVIHHKAHSERPLSVPSVEACSVALYPVFFEGL